MSWGRLTLALLVVMALVWPSTAAAVPTLTKKQAVRAVTREVKVEYRLDYPDVTCKRLSRVRMKCRFQGLTDADVFEGNIEGHRGTAYVQRYSYGIDVRITSYRRA